MVDRNVFALRLGKLEETLRHLRRLQEVPLHEFMTDPGLQAQAERWSQVAVECSLDIANHLIADRGLGAPSTNREVFGLLQADGLLDQELAEQMAGWAGLRNLIVHMYLDVDYQRLYEILQEDLDQLERFAKALSEV